MALAKNLELGSNVCKWQIFEPHSAIFIAIKRPVATGSLWPIFARHGANFTVDSTSAFGLIADSLD